jgi:hypothetical protein
VSCDGAAPVGAEIVGASPATALTEGRAELDEPDGVAACDDSDEGEL